MFKVLTALLMCSALYMQSATADVITEFGIGYKLPDSTSLVLRSECHTVERSKRVDGSSIRWNKASCGGPNPAFIGWPVAWEHEFEGPWTIRAGWFHFSHWFDGSGENETHMDAAVVSFKFNWSKRNRRPLDE